MLIVSTWWSCKSVISPVGTSEINNRSGDVFKKKEKFKSCFCLVGFFLNVDLKKMVKGFKDCCFILITDYCFDFNRKALWKTICPFWDFFSSLSLSLPFLKYTFCTRLISNKVSYQTDNQNKYRIQIIIWLIRGKKVWNLLGSVWNCNWPLC